MKDKNINWGLVNWRRIDIVLSEELDVTRERIRQKRLEITALLRNRRGIQALLANREGNLTRLRGLRTECVGERRGVMLRIAKERGFLQKGDLSAQKRLNALLLERRELRLRIKNYRQKIKMLEHPAEIEQVLKLSLKDMRPSFWHRPSDTREIFDILAGLKLEEMTRSEIIAALKAKGVERGFSWVSKALEDLGRTCKRKPAIRESKYQWGKVVTVNGKLAVLGGVLTLEEYQALSDRECAERLGIKAEYKESIVTQWRMNHGIVKIHEEKELVH